MFVYEEDVTKGLDYVVKVNNVDVCTKSEFQSIHVLDTVALGRMLVLDGKVQSATIDECCYHESLVHPAMLAHPNPKKVAILGGGEGGTLREVLRHRTVESVVMVDIDGTCVEACRKYMPELSNGGFEDARTTLIVGDAKKFLEESTDHFDVIIGDLADPVDDNPCYLLYSAEFYADVVRPRLAKGGIFVTQCGPAGIATCTQYYSATVKTIQSVFAHTQSHCVFIQSFCDNYGYGLGSDSPLPVLSVAEADARIKERMTGTNKFLDGVSYTSVVHTPKYLRDAIAAETRIVKYDQPLFVFSKEGEPAGIVGKSAKKRKDN